ncbi:TrmH family RNA methyltransferase [Prosthecobacter dejongeii]|uniref:TrmH family RNA methyltransferase n=1 Tax=Prosthecobacter dejongeii TaxID=48465 RepID=A0A7W7YJJ5_9BACT|nr:RNA methyltransferase [Prosthecobacter dejongeii]MBB5037035.1 TrmH family RNA methyltransferase [Prosthecobacter dejongeii]
MTSSWTHRRGCAIRMSMQITSASNEKIKHARRVRDGREPGLIFIEGLRLAEEAVNSDLTIEVCFSDSLDPSEPRLATLLHRLEQNSVPHFTTTTDIIRGMSDTVRSQGIILIARRPGQPATGIWQKNATLLLGLDRLQDPGNLGTLIRTAEAAGVGGIVSLKGSADAFSPKVLRSSMGSAFRLPLLENASPADLQALQANQGFQIVAAAGEGEMDYTDYNWQQPTLLLLGNEGRGVAPELMQQCDVRLRIPMHAGVESLNVAAAGAVMLFEAARQRR